MKKVLVILLICNIALNAQEVEKYSATCSKITLEIRDRMQYSYPQKLEESAPVPLEDLRYITIKYYGFDEKVHDGELVMHKLAAIDIIEIFEQLFEDRFPIENMQLVDEYQGSNTKSIIDNNSYALCVRFVACQNKWSNHAFGTAIDINPQQNPYYEANRNGTGEEYIEPIDRYGTKYLDRTLDEPGMITKDSLIYKLFIKRGWEWGGECLDYCEDMHHFQKVIPGLNKTKN